MNFDPLSADLINMEERLRQRPVHAASPALQSRIMQAVNLELVAPIPTPSRGGRPLMYSMGLTVIGLIGVTLSMTAPSVTALARRADGMPQSTPATVRALQRLSPDLSVADATRMCVLFDVGGNLTPLPNLRASASRNSLSMPIHEGTIQ